MQKKQKRSRCFVELENIIIDLSKSFKRDIQLKKIKEINNNLGQLKKNQAVLIKNSYFKTKYIVLINFDNKPKPEVIRGTLANCFKRIRDKNINSVAFLTAGFKKNVNVRIFSKIIAQELFRFVRSKKEIILKRVSFITYTEQSYKILKKNIIGYLNHIKANRGPFLTVDAIICYKKGIVLIKRTNPPLGWALPGGFVDYGEKLEKAVAREAKEETGLDFKDVKQFKVYSDNKRDPRFHTVSVVFLGKGKGRLKAASDAKDASVFMIKGRDPLLNLPPNIAFDHKKIIKDYIKDKRQKKKG
ncbi:MAG: NUDIX hydrolase [Candidatus Omnitrophica bacterium]|nr:NUDIX hydrolase [Candidatus Omnitrophota bacterium]MCF7894512.1 NUDIX hydrolase [Candidatus Omnitrophota bacterium]